MILHGNSLEELKKVKSSSVQCCITSPPYYKLRDYGYSEQIGQEKTVMEYIESLRKIFKEVYRILKDDGTLWLNIGDTYSGSSNSLRDGRAGFEDNRTGFSNCSFLDYKTRIPSKNLIGIPWRIAFALQDSGWILRQDIIWRKPNPMPSSVTDRCTTAHEYLFLFAKNQKYFFNSEAIKEPVSESYAKDKRPKGVLRQRLYKNSKYAKQGMYNIDIESIHRQGIHSDRGNGFVEKRNLPEKEIFIEYMRSKYKIKDLVEMTGLPKTHVEHWFRNDDFFAFPTAEDWEKVNDEKFPELIETRIETDGVGKNSNGMRNKHSVWNITVQPFKGAHFAVMPLELVTNCLLAGTKEDDIVIDPFFGSGTVGVSAIQNKRDFIGIEFNREYVNIAEKRIKMENPSLISVL